MDLDIHADLGLPDLARWDDLEVVYVARRTLETGIKIGSRLGMSAPWIRLNRMWRTAPSNGSMKRS